MTSRMWCKAANTSGHGKILGKDPPTAIIGRSAAVMCGPVFSHKVHRAVDAGVWNGHS